MDAKVLAGVSARKGTAMNVATWIHWLRLGVCAVLLWACGSSNTPVNSPADTSVPDAATADAGSPQTSAPEAGVSVDSSAPSSVDATSTSGDANSATGDAGSTAADGSPSATLALIHYLGRFDTSDSAGPKFAWPGSAIVATFTGTGISVQLADGSTSSASNYFVVIVDGAAPNAIQTNSATQTYTLASGLALGQHTVVLTKRTESFVGVVQFLGFQPHGGSLVPSLEPFVRRFELVGDSITCGYGDLGNGPNCTWSSATEDVTITYGELAAQQLSAQATVIAYSGIGVYRNVDGSATNLMSTRFERTLADDPTSQWGFTTPPPDVVVINLGTNDFGAGDPGQGYVTAYVALLHQVRQHYANAYIICASSPMLGSPSHETQASYLQAAITQFGDARVAYLDFATQDTTTGLGCDWHPGPLTHQQMATVLAAKIRATVGW